MRYGIDVAIIGELADPGRVVELAQAAEAAGWEAMFVWDHLAFAWGWRRSTHGWSWLPQRARRPDCGWAQR